MSELTRLIADLKGVRDQFRFTASRVGEPGCLVRRTAVEHGAVVEEALCRLEMLSGGAGDLLDERRRQVNVEGWTPEHDDDEHNDGELARAAAAYALNGAFDDPSKETRRVCREWLWPWEFSWWKPGARRRSLIKAGALILAEIERLDRQAART